MFSVLGASQLAVELALLAGNAAGDPHQLPNGLFRGSARRITLVVIPTMQVRTETSRTAALEVRFPVANGDRPALPGC